MAIDMRGNVLLIDGDMIQGRRIARC